MSATGPRSPRLEPAPGDAGGRGRPGGSSDASWTPPTRGWRDPWAWASALALIPLVVRSLGAPLGVPVADDWDFVHRALLTGERSLLDGGGSTAFWRPIPHQLYYRLCSSLMLAQPHWVATLHAVLLVAMTLLAYRAARTRLPGAAAALVASFPLLAESTRAIVAWPSHAVELSFLFFSVLALHEAAFRRLPTAALALLAALLSKEVAVVTALLLPWVPPAAAGARERWRERRRWAIGAAAVTLTWGLAYLAVRRAHDLHLPHDLETGAATAGTPWPARYAWALANSARAAMSLPVVHPAWEPLVWGALVAILGVAALSLARRPAARARLRLTLPLVVFGGLWFAAAAAPLTVVFPMWMPHRSIFGGLGLALALAAGLGAVRPALLAALLVARLATFMLGPVPPATITPLPPASGAFLDFEKLVRLQRLMVETRRALEVRHPTLPRGARVGLLRPPIMTEYAYGGSLALQAWYRDSTLRWLRYDDFRHEPEMPLAAVVLYEPERTPQVMLVEPSAMRHYLQAGEALRRSDAAAALHHLGRAEALQADTTARMFASLVGGRRALCWLDAGRTVAAEREARSALARWRECSDARFVLASVLALTGRVAEGQAELDTLLRIYPRDRSALVLRDSLEVWTAPR